MNNIFYQEFDTPHGLIPFDRITVDQYEPAILHGIKEQNDEVKAICDNPDEPTFDNTILALERSGSTLSRVLGVFYPMLEAMVDDKMMAIADAISPILAEHSSSITLNEALWLRIKYVKDHCDVNDLDCEDARLLANTYDSFVRSGAMLVGDDRSTFRELKKKLTSLTLKFQDNVLKATNAYELWLTDNDVDGLPESALEAAQLAAREHGGKSGYLITLHAPSYMAFMKYSTRRDLREQLYRAYNGRCVGNELSNNDIIKEIVNTRLSLAQLMGYKTFAEYRLVKSMAQTPGNVLDLLKQLKNAYQPVEQAEVRDLREFASQLEGHDIDIMPWDFAYYSSKKKEATFAFDDAALRPYFELSNVIKGVFGLATRLYGLNFIENRQASVFDPYVKVFDVNDENGETLGFLYTDFFPRSTKRGGAWMTIF